MELRKLVVKRKTGRESFHSGNIPLEFTVLDFWQWIASDLVSNATRGLVAEFIVASALGLASDVRDEWRAFDLLTVSKKKIEVKSAAYLQSWNQHKLSEITFNVRRTRAWDSETNVLSVEAMRQADVYVFAVLNHKEKHSLDPLDVDQWEFYVVPTSTLDGRQRSQHSITLKSLQKLCPAPIRFSELRNAIEGCGASA